MASEEFIQINNIPCKECLVQSMCRDKKYIDREMERYKLFEFLLALRRWDESKKVYRKGLIEAWANLGWTIFRNLRTSEFSELPGKVAPVYLDLLIELSALIQWIINSSSWREGEKFDFDITEIKNRLEKSKFWVDKSLRYVDEK
jgi:hypothetical protein